jgi:hypothetical protein
MATRLSVQPPTPDEEVRQLAEIIADTHYIISLMIENGKEFLPGEAIEEMEHAWQTSQENIQGLILKLTPTTPPSNDYPPIEHKTLAENGLTGEVGKIKKSFFSRLKDRFLMLFNSDPRTTEKRAEAADAASEVLEMGSTIVSSIPGHEQFVEIISLVKQMIGVRRKRGV